MNGRVLFYVQHLLGVGHLRRAEILAEAMAAHGLDVTVALGGPQLAGIRFRGATLRELPAARIENEDFATLLDAARRPVNAAWKAARTAALLDLAKSASPDVLLLELFPFGRRQFRFELIPLLEMLHGLTPRPRIACSVRDILVASRKPGREAEIVAVLRRYFDRVLVHGDPSLIPFFATFPAAAEIADLIRYTGYVVAETHPSASSEGRDEVLVSAGGGAVGAPLLQAAMAARPLTPLAGNVWRFLGGPNFPDADYARLAAASDARTIIERFRPDFSARLRTAALSISQAGYNTTMDILRAAAPAVVVPYEAPGETEQRLRSDLLAGRGLLTVLPAADLSRRTLAEAISAALLSAQARRAGASLPSPQWGEAESAQADRVRGLSLRHAEASPPHPTLSPEARGKDSPPRSHSSHSTLGIDFNGAAATAEMAAQMAAERSASRGESSSAARR